MRSKLVGFVVAVASALSSAHADEPTHVPPFDEALVCYLTALGERCADQSSVDPAALLAARAREGRLFAGALWWSKEHLTITRSSTGVVVTPSREGRLTVSARGGTVNTDFCLSISRHVAGVEYVDSRCFPAAEMRNATLSTPVLSGIQYHASVGIAYAGSFLPSAATISSIRTDVSPA